MAPCGNVMGFGRAAVKVVVDDIDDVDGAAVLVRPPLAVLALSCCCFLSLGGVVDVDAMDDAININ